MNVVYEEVNSKAKESAREYDNAEVILQSSGQGREGGKTRDRLCTSKSAVSEHSIDSNDAVAMYYWSTMATVNK